MKVKGFLVYCMLTTVVVVLGLVFALGSFENTGPGMEPTMQSGQRVMAIKICPAMCDMKRGDLVVMKDPRNKKDFVVRRIVALGGEQVEVSNSAVSVVSKEHPGGEKLVEDYAIGPTEARTDKGWVKVPAKAYYLLADNRPEGEDSRLWGTIGSELIIGKVVKY